VQSIKPGVPVVSRLLAQVQRGEIQIPALPAVVTELRELLTKADSKIEVIVALLERDPALVARVLQLGRSASVSSSSPPPQDLRYIVNRVGFRQVSDVVETVWAHNCFAIADARYTPLVTLIARHSLARAVAMRALAEEARLDHFSAYLAGLFADVGATFLLSAVVDKLGERAPDPPGALALVRQHHESMSAIVLKKWGHAELVIGLVRRHHALVLTPPVSPYASLLVVAAQMAAELTGEADVTIEPPWPPPALLDRCASHVGLNANTQRNILGRLRQEYASALGTLR
jgi:HD-like signal output (HDOD) protein